MILQEWSGEFAEEYECALKRCCDWGWVDSILSRHGGNELNAPGGELFIACLILEHVSLSCTEQIKLGSFELVY